MGRANLVADGSIPSPVIISLCHIIKMHFTYWTFNGIKIKAL